MGCDIHICTEAKPYYGNKDRWCNIDHWIVDEEYPEEGLEEFRKNQWYLGRDYILFGTLAAGVRVRQ